MIRSVGASSLLGFLLSDILYQYSLDITRFDKVSEILGKDPEGNKIKVNRSYAPIYERIADNIPTNYIELSHCKKYKETTQRSY